MRRWNMTMIVFGLAAILLASVPLDATATASEAGPVPPGTVITPQNWQQYKQYMTNGLQALFSGQYFWKFPNDFKIVVSATTPYHLPAKFISDTEKYASQVKIVNLPDGGHNITGYVAGLPFPNPQEPLRGWKLLVDDWYSYQPVVTCGPDSPVWTQDRLYNRSMVGQIWDNRRMMHNSDPGEPINDPKANGRFLVEYTQITSPEQARYTTVLTVYYDDLSKPEDLYIFIPALRRSLRLSSGARCSPFAGSDWTYDDTHRGAFNGNATRFDADYLGERKVLENAMNVTDNLDTLLNLDNYYQPILFGKPVLGTWQIRDTWMINAHPIAAYAKGYCYGKRIL
jgi:hypothetical protein